MNLNYDPTTEALRELVATADPKLYTHHIALDYDGEVIMDPEVHYPYVDLRRYKFCAEIKNENLHNMRKLQALQSALMYSFKNYLHTISHNDDLMSIAA